MIKNPKILIRTDADTKLGMGHLSRCLTLAKELKALGAETAFVMRSPSPLVHEKVAGIKADLHELPLEMEWEDDLARLLSVKQNLGAAGIVLDGYQFTESYLHKLGRNARCLFFDELAEFHFENALVLNQNVHAHAMNYRAAPSTRLLLGPHYAVLRPEFAEAKQSQRRHSPQAERILVTFGGSDPHGLTAWSLECLANCQQRFWIKAVMGSKSEQAEKVASLADKSPHKVEILHNVSDMASLMNWADMALSASGTNTTLEMSCLGLPMVLIIQAENQRLIGEEMGRQGLAVQLGFWSQVEASAVKNAVDSLAGDQARRRDMSALLIKTVDGLGAQRVAQALLESCGGEPR